MTTRGTHDIAVTARWRQAGLPDVTHEFASFWEAAEEQANSRRWGGIHYGFDAVAGQQAARKVAEFVFANHMVPRRH